MNTDIIDEGFVSKSIRNNSARAKALLVFFYIYFAVSALQIFPYVRTYIAVAESSDIWEFSTRAAQNNSVGTVVFESSLYILGFLSFIFLIIFWILWMRRAYFNVEQIADHKLHYSNSACAWSWFIPVLNLWVPYQLMRTIWNETQDKLQMNQRLRESPAIVGVWWFLYLAGIMLGFCIVIYNYVSLYMGIQDYSASFNLGFIRSQLIIEILRNVVLGILTTAVSIMMVRKIQALEATLWQQKQKQIQEEILQANAE